MKHIGKKSLSSFQIILYGFSGLILLGTLLLKLPISSKNPVTFSDALFTSTSAVCVTGLVVRDTADTWTLFGQVIILMLIQIGGLGVVAAAGALAIASGRRISLLQRSTLKDSLSAPHLGGIVRLTRFIILTLFSAEGIGAAILAVRFVPRYGPIGIWYAVFHSVSAACNAGFDLMGRGRSLTAYVSDPLVSLTIAALIIFGGLGFLTWNDIAVHGLHVRRYSLQSKLSLTVTITLLIIPTLYYFFLECGEYRGLTRFLAAFFMAVTPRTAGFNTINLAHLSETGVLVTICLMLTGGSPSSTAGGMKTTTAGVLLLSCLSIFERKDRPDIFRRSIGEDAVHNALSIAMLYIGLFTVGGALISRIEDLPLLPCLFETASAIGTVGLTLGLTSSLSLISRAVLIALMFIGRVGGLTLIYAVFPAVKTKHVHYANEKVMVG